MTKSSSQRPKRDDSPTLTAKLFIKALCDISREANKYRYQTTFPIEIDVSTDTRQQALIRWLQLLHYEVTKLSSVSSDASARRYFRFQHLGKSFIAVDTPLPETENKAFIDLGQALHRAGLHTPTIHHADTHKGWMLVEDFGSTSFADALSTNSDTLPLYRQAIGVIAEIQSSPALQTHSNTLPSYTPEMVTRELNIFPQWCLQGHLDIELDAQDKADWQSLTALLTGAFDEQPKTFVHRDFHSRNLMVLDDLSLGLIDFQGAVRGPLTYDWVSLLRDCYVDMPAAQLEALFQELHASVLKEHSCECSLKGARRWFDLTGMQRHLKAIGIFCRLKQQDNKPAYMADVPRTFKYVHAAAKRYEELAPLTRLIERHQLVERLC